MLFIQYDKRFELSCGCLVEELLFIETLMNLNITRTISIPGVFFIFWPFILVILFQESNLC